MSLTVLQEAAVNTAYQAIQECIAYQNNNHILNDVLNFEEFNDVLTSLENAFPSLFTSTGISTDETV